jgi:hypothetical protein
MPELFNPASILVSDQNVWMAGYYAALPGPGWLAPLLRGRRNDVATFQFILTFIKKRTHND